MSHEIAVAPAEGRMQRKREVRLEAILDAATALLATDGLEALTLQRVATATGYVPAALYRYVGSKDGLLAALQRRAVADAHRAFSEAMRAAGERDAVGALLVAARFYLELPRTRPETWLLVALLLGDPRPLLSDEESRKTAPLLVAFLGDVQALFERAAAAGALARGDAMQRTLAFWAVLHGAAALAKMQRVAPQLPGALEVGEAGARALLAGWGASSADVQRAARRVARRGRE